MNGKEGHRDRILEVLNTNDIIKFKDFIKKNKINLIEFKNDFDILIYAIENNFSIEIVKCIIHLCEYKIFNYSFYVTRENRIKYHPLNFRGYKNPLFSAIALSNFEIADFLLKSDEADINYILTCYHDYSDNNNNNNNNNSEEYKTNILQYLSNIDYLNSRNLKYILNKKFSVDGITSDLINHWINLSYKNDLLEIVFKHYIYDEPFIISLLQFYKNKTPLSNKHFKLIIEKEKGKIKIEDSMYSNVMKRWSEKMKIIGLLVKYDSKEFTEIMDIINRHDILQKAVYLNDEDLVKQLLNSNKIDFSAINLEQIIIEGMAYNYNHIIKYLITKLFDHGQQLNLSDNGSPYESILLKASYFNNLNIMEFLISKLLNESYENSLFSSIITQLNSSYLSLILNILIKIRHFDTIQKLLKNDHLNLDINNSDKNNDYPVITAYNCTKTRINKHRNISQEIFKCLLEYGSNIFVKDQNEKKSLLSIAIEEKNYTALKWILKYNKDNKDIEKYIEIHDSWSNALCNNFDGLQNIINNSDTYSWNGRYYDGLTPLIFSYFLNYQNIFKYLLDFVDIYERDQYGNTIFYYALLKEDKETIKYLISIDNNNNNNTKEKKNRKTIKDNCPSPLHILIELGNKDIFLFLLKNKGITDVDEENILGETPMMSLIKSRNYSDEDKKVMIEKLIQHRSDINFVNKKNYRTPLGYAIQMKSTFLIKFLIENGAQVNYVAYTTFQSLLVYALQLEDFDTLKCLIESVQENDLIDGFVKKLIQNFEEKHNEDLFEYVVKYNINNINVRILRSVINENKIQLLKELIGPDYNINVNMKDKQGNISLVYAIKTRNIQIIKYLIEHHANIHSINHKGDTIEDINKIYNYNYYKDIYNKINDIINNYH